MYVEKKWLEQVILKAEPSTINKIAKNYTEDKLSKKIGKKIAVIKKETIEILKSQAVQQYSQFLISNHLPFHTQTTTFIFDPNNLNFFTNILPVSTLSHTFKINELLLANSIKNLDNIFISIIHYNFPHILHE